MPQFVETATRTFTNGSTALAKGTRVVLSSGVLAAAAVGERDLGVLEYRAEADEPAAVRLLSAQGTQVAIAAGEIAAGAIVSTAASGKVNDVAATGSFERGMAVTGAAADGDLIEIIPFIGETSA
mgnify:CR=1 FL=1